MWVLWNQARNQNQLDQNFTEYKGNMFDLYNYVLLFASFVAKGPVQPLVGFKMGL